MTRIVAALFFLGGVIQEGPPAVEGDVLNVFDGRLIAGARVSLAVSGESMLTDASGRFAFAPDAVATTDTLVVTYADFIPHRLPLAGLGEGVRVRIGLMPLPITAPDPRPGNDP